MSHRVPLESLPTERAVLGAILRQPGLYWDNRQRFAPELFATPLHRHIMRAIMALSVEGREITIAGVLPRLPTPEEGESFTPEGYLAMLVGDQADVQNALDLLSDLEDMQARRSMAKIGQGMIEAASEDGSAQDALAKHLERAQSLMIDAGAVEPVRTRHAILDRMVKQVAEAYKRDGTGAQPWVLRAIRQVVGDEAEAGWLFGILADSGGGKTSLALQQIMFAAERGQPQLFFSCDQTEEMCWLQMASQKLGISAGLFRRGQVTEKQFGLLSDAVRNYRGLPIEIRKIGRPSIQQLVAEVRAFRRRYGKGFAFTLDHAKRVKMGGRNVMLAEHVNELFGELKGAALDTESAGIVLMQRNSEGSKRDDPRPRRGDIYGGEGAVENFDAVFALYVEETWITDELKKILPDRRRDQLVGRLESVKGRAELITLKARFGPPGKSAQIVREPELTRFADLRVDRAREQQMLDLERLEPAYGE